MNTKLRNEVTQRVKQEVHRPDFGVRIIIVWKIIKGCLLLAVGIAAFGLVGRDLHGLGLRLVEWLGIDPASPRIAHLLHRLIDVSSGRMVAVGIGAMAVATVMFIEAWGLHRRRVWAEWLTVIVTASLIPLEFYHLAHHTTIGKVLTLIANIAIVIYLLRHRWLFVPGRIGRWWQARKSRG